MQDVHAGRRPERNTGAMVEEEEEVEDDGKTVALAKGGVTDPARIALKATQASLLCHLSQGGMKTIIRTKGLGASTSRAQSLASWAAPTSQRIFKQFAREVNVVLPKLEATRPLRWSECAIMFSSADQLKCAATAGVLPMLCSPIISNVQVTRTLIDGGAGLNVLSVETFNNLQVPYN